jgi:hypothetical protein
VLDLACALVGDDAGASNLEEERPIDAWGIEHLVEPYDPDWLRALPPDGHALHPLDHQRMNVSISSAWVPCLNGRSSTTYCTENGSARTGAAAPSEQIQTRHKQPIRSELLMEISPELADDGSTS